MSAVWVETGTGLWVPASAAEQLAEAGNGYWSDEEEEGSFNDRWRADMPRQELRLVGCDLFCGAGGFSCGMHEGGVDVVAAVEFDEWAAITYLTNLGRPDCRVAFDGPESEARWNKAHRKKTITRKGKKVGITPADMEEFTGGPWIGSAYRKSSNMPGGCRGFFVGDAKKVTGKQLLELAGVDHFDIVFGGPPCQGLSKSNSKACIEDPRNGLLWEFLRIVEELKPRCFLIENVPQLLSAGNGGLFRALEKRALAAGYDVCANVLDAVNYGVPQYRRRAFVQGLLAEENQGRAIQFPVPTHWPWGATVEGKSWRQQDRDPTMRSVSKAEPTETVEYDEETETFRRVAAEAPPPEPERPTQRDLFGEGAA